MTAAQPIERPRRAEASIAAISFIWGATFVVVKEALNDASTFVFLSLRFSMGALLLAIALRGRLRRRLRSVTPGAEWTGGAI